MPWSLGHQYNSATAKTACWLQAGIKAIKSKGMASRCALGSSFALCLNLKNEKRHLIPSAFSGGTLVTKIEFYDISINFFR